MAGGHGELVEGGVGPRMELGWPVGMENYLQVVLNLGGSWDGRWARRTS